MDFMELAKARYSVRSYLPREVEAEKLDQILEAGRVAPTAANRQPQRVLVVRSSEGLAKLSGAANLYGAPLALVVCADRSEAWTRPFDSWQSADTDAAIVTDHMMLEAASLGLGSVWVCYFQPEKIRESFQLPESLVPLNILAVGYAAGEPQPPERHDSARKPLAETVFYETF